MALLKFALLGAVLLISGTQARLPVSLQEKWGFLERLDDSARVVGGENAAIGEAPYQISLIRDYVIIKQHMCGGSLYNPRTVITAAHCTEGQKPGSLIVRMGTNKANTPGAGAPDVKVTEIRQHADYNPNTIENDISLLILANPVSPSSNVDFIPLETEDLADGDPVKVFGWGLTDGNAQSTPNDLQKGQLKVVSREKCQAKWGDVNAIAPGMICAIAESTQACNGDSGGPLVSASGKLTGVVSWGPSKCPPGEYMAVFTLPKYYKDWIAEKAAN